VAKFLVHEDRAANIDGAALFGITTGDAAYQKQLSSCTAESTVICVGSAAIAEADRAAAARSQCIYVGADGIEANALQAKHIFATRHEFETSGCYLNKSRRLQWSDALLIGEHALPSIARVIASFSATVIPGTADRDTTQWLFTRLPALAEITIHRCNTEQGVQLGN
jgi:hypothetical protein